MNKKLFIISLILFVDVTGNGLILPLLPFFADNLGASPLIVGLFISTYPFFAILSGPFLGQLSDRFGRKPVLLASLVGTIAGYLLLGVAGSLLLLFLARVIDGVSAGNSSTARAVIADISSKEQRTSKLGLTFAAESLGLIAGPLIGGFFAQYGFTVAAYIAAGIALLAFLLTFFFLPETKNFTEAPAAETQKSGPNFGEVFKALEDGRVRNFIFVVFIVQFLIMVMWGTVPLYSQALYGFSGTEMGYVSSFAAVVGIFSQTVLLNVALRYVKEKTILVAGLTSMGIGMSLIGLSSHVAWMLVGVGLMAMSWNISMPTVTGLASEFSAEEDQGRLMGTISSTANIGSLTGPVVGNAIYTLSMHGIYFFSAVVALIAAVLSLRGIDVRRRTGEEEAEVS